MKITSIVTASADDPEIAMITIMVSVIESIVRVINTVFNILKWTTLLDLMILILYYIHIIKLMKSVAIN